MARCDVCGNDYDKSFQITARRAGPDLARSTFSLERRGLMPGVG
jgi:hypothetical protein